MPKNEKQVSSLKACYSVMTLVPLGKLPLFGTVVLSVPQTEKQEPPHDHFEQNTQRHRAYHCNIQSQIQERMSNRREPGTGFVPSVNIRQRITISCSSHSGS